MKNVWTAVLWRAFAAQTAGVWLKALLLFVTLGASVANAAQVEVVRAASSPAITQSVVKIELTQRKVMKGVDGKEQLVDAAAIKPGEVIEYRATYTNRSTKAISGLVADLPIPEGLEYLGKSARPASPPPKVAVKDGNFAVEPLMRRTVENKLELLPLNEYRKVRWMLGELPSGGVAQVRLRARVEVAEQKAPMAAASAPVPAKP